MVGQLKANIEKDITELRGVSDPQISTTTPPAPTAPPAPKSPRMKLPVEIPEPSQQVNDIIFAVPTSPRK